MKRDPVKDLRKFTRLDWYYPVEFTIVSLNEALPGIGWKQGSTCNVSAEGLCLEFVDLEAATLKYLQKQNTSMKLRLNIPPTEMPVKAVGEVVWYAKDSNNKFTIGLRFTTIVDDDLKNILRYAHWKKTLRKLIIFLSLFVIAMGVFLTLGQM